MQNKPGIYLLRLIRFIAAVFFIVVLLALLNWIPSLIQKHKFKKYQTIEAARKELNLRSMRFPTYIPEHLKLAWPPSEVFAQDAPFEALILHFTYRDGKGIGLIIQQTESNAPYSLDPKIKVKSDKAAKSIFIKDRKAELLPALCDGDISCNQISWDEHGILITLTGKFPAQDLIRVATSMLPDN